MTEPPYNKIVYIKPFTKEILRNLKKADKHFYKTYDQIFMCVLTDHLLRLRKEKKLDQLCANNPELKKLIPKIIYQKKILRRNPITFENPKKSVSEFQRGNTRGSHLRSSNNHLVQKKEVM